MNMDIAQRLIQLRQQAGYSIPELAEKLSCACDTVVAWESGEASPDADALLALAKLYGVTVDSLLQRPVPGSEEVDPHDPLPNGSYFEHKERERERARRRFPYPVLVTAAYLVLGFVFGAWHPGWIIFLTIPLFYLPSSQRTPLRLLGNPVMITIIYLLLGCFCNLWHPGWLIFLTIPLFQRINQ